MMKSFAALVAMVSTVAANSELELAECSASNIINNFNDVYKGSYQTCTAGQKVGWGSTKYEQNYLTINLSGG